MISAKQEVQHGLPLNPPSHQGRGGVGRAGDTCTARTEGKAPAVVWPLSYSVSAGISQQPVGDFNGINYLSGISQFHLKLPKVNDTFK